MSVEFWKAVFDWAAVILVGLTFIAGFGALATGRVISDRQEDRLREFDHNLTIAKIELAKQEQRAAEAEKETARLKILVLGRELTPEQSKQISSALKPFSGKNVFVASYIGDSEAARLGLQIKASLERAGISVTDQMGSTFATPGRVGSVAWGIGVSALPSQQKLCEAIANALREYGRLEAKPHVVLQMPPGYAEVGIMVGARPLPKIE